MTTVTATNVCDAFGSKITDATAYFTPCTPLGVTLTGFNVGGGGQAGFKAVSTPVANGAFSVQLHDTTQTNPVNVAYRLEVKDAGGTLLLGPWVIQPSGATWSFDSFVPNMAPLALIQIGAQGDSAYTVAVKNGYSGTQPQWIASLKGAPGDVSKGVLGQAAGLAVALQVPPGRNRYNSATVKADTLILTADGSEGPWGVSGHYYASDFIYVGDLTQFITNTVLAQESSSGCVFYYADKSFLSALPSTVAANTPVNVPAGAAFVRFYSSYPAFPSTANPSPLNPSAIMLVGGSVLPTSFVSYGYYLKEEVNAKVLQSSQSSLAQIPNYGPALANLLDLNRGQASTVIRYPSATGLPSVFSGFAGYTLYGPIPVIGGGTVTVNKRLHCNSGYGPAFTDASGNFLPMGSDLQALWTAGAGIPTNTALNVPAAAVSFWMYINLSAGGTGDNSPIDNVNTAMVVQGATFPASYQPFGGFGNDPTARTLALPMTGVKVGWLGDSLSYGYGSNIPLAPLVASITGHTNAYALSWTGRRMWDALNNTGNTGVAFPTQAIVQGLDVLVLWLGTNLSGGPDGTIGAATDAVSVGTTGANGITYPNTDSYCSQLKAVIEQLLTWNPALRIIKASPYQSNNQNAPTGGTGGAGNIPTAAGLALLKKVHDMDVAIAGLQYGIPVLDLYSEMGICNANNQALLPDGTHPTAATQNNRIGPYFARNIIRYSTK